jgi:hypothetical protein
MKFKRAQSATALVAVVAGIIILYILFLPPAEREALLSDNETEDSGNGGTSLSDNLTLLFEKPNRLEYLKNDKFDHNLQAFNLYSTTEANVLEEIDSLTVRRNMFSKELKNITFEVLDVEHTENILLSFNAPTRRGKLIVYLNGNLISEKEIKNQNPTPINIPKKYVQKLNNLEFQVSGPGALFWMTNEITLEKVKITADITDVSGLESKQFFFVTDIEEENLDQVKFKFIPDCKVDNVGILDISLNNQNIYSLVPDCGMLNSVEIDPNRILAGENKMIFKTNKGTYALYSLKIETKLKEPVYPTYYFELDSEEYKKIENESYNVNLSIVFSNDVDLKEAAIKINNHAIGVSTREMVYSRLINNYVREGNNALEFYDLKTRLDILELKIKLVKK